MKTPAGAGVDTAHSLLLYDIFTSFWRHVTVLPQRNHFLHDLITRVFLRSLQYGIRGNELP